ncbi:COX15/CtaA family protein [Urechidicola vernalis]|uniref:Heme A synthase n=1 Tax=Urechidicola vernalis TaxID=3075600 RepID=A0ABU2Y0H4_9FLAO|nr:COX15/CtaA family protein [Urechidicola sp. P050]MDT0551659.1 COX15/CtaA family protein [Urechidicola sp. P050]
MNILQKKYVTAWLYSGLVLVALMVIIGGITRLTQSGLSMVEWKLISGAIPPLNEAEWLETFAKYQQFPEYQKINKGMTLAEFKMIFFWEYLHRVLGRLIGIVFIIPFAFFWFKKWFNSKQKKQLIVLLVLGGFQGFLGWFMVKSGLVDNPHVSHYRLAIHLLAAFGLMCYIYWLILSFNSVAVKTNTLLNKLSKWFIGLLIIQIIYGAFVAGLKAGYLLQLSNSVLKNLIGYTVRGTNDFDILNNPFDVQAFHRIFAWIVFAFAVYIFKKSRNTAMSGIGNVLFGLVLLQVTLGIATLLLRVQIHTAVTHQFVAILLLLATIRMTYLSQSKA